MKEQFILIVSEYLVTRGKVYVSTAVIYICSLLWSLSPFLGWGKYGLQTTSTYCSIDWIHPNSDLFVTVIFIMCFLLPTATTVTAYIKVVLSIRKQAMLSKYERHVTKVRDMLPK